MLIAGPSNNLEKVRLRSSLYNDDIMKRRVPRLLLYIDIRIRSKGFHRQIAELNNAVDRTKVQGMATSERTAVGPPVSRILYRV